MYICHKNEITNWKLALRTRIRLMNEAMSKLGYKFLAAGRHRRTYLSPDKKHVIKIPYVKDGLKVNKSEADLYRRSKGKPNPMNGMVYAKCSLIQGVFIKMEAVTSTFGDSWGDNKATKRKVLKKAQDKSKMPIWAYDTDCCQVGITADGKFVAYDYGRH